MQDETTVLPSINTIALGMFCGPKILIVHVNMAKQGATCGSVALNAT